MSFTPPAIDNSLIAAISELFSQIKNRADAIHSTQHKNGGVDEIATATPAANAIPKAGSGGTLAAGWIPNPSATTLGGVQSAAAQAGKVIDSISTTGVPNVRALASADIPANSANTSGTAATFTGSLTGDITSTAMATLLATTLCATINANVGSIPELFALVGMLANGLWPVADDATGGLIFPKTMRVNGRLMFAVPSTAPTDADIPNGFAAPWVDETAHALVFRIRESGGSLITRTVAT